MQHFFHQYSPIGCKYFEVKDVSSGNLDQGSRKRIDTQENRCILPAEKAREAQELEIRHEEKMTKFLQEFDDIDEVIQEEVHWTEETAWLQKTR